MRTGPRSRSPPRREWESQSGDAAPGARASPGARCRRAASGASLRTSGPPLSPRSHEMDILRAPMLLPAKTRADLGWDNLLEHLATRTRTPRGVQLARELAPLDS